VFLAKNKQKELHSVALKNTFFLTYNFHLSSMTLNNKSSLSFRGCWRLWTICWLCVMFLTSPVLQQECYAW